MTKGIVFLIALFISFSISAQIKNTSESVDTIFRVNGQIMFVNVTTVTPNFVNFVNPNNNEAYRIERKEIHKIIYKSGRMEELNAPAFELISENSWEAVWLAEDKDDVSNLYFRGEIDAVSPQSARSPKAAKTGASIRIQKKAAALGATVVLVTYREKTGGYGEFPGYIIKGVAYGLEPLEEGGK